MPLIGELLPWSLFSEGRNLDDGACPVLVIWSRSQGNGVSGDFPPGGGSGKPVETQWVLLHGKSCSVCSPALSCASLLVCWMQMCRSPGCLIPYAPTSLVYSGCAGSGVPAASYAWCRRCLSITAPRSLGKRSCSRRVSCGALPARGGHL